MVRHWSKSDPAEHDFSDALFAEFLVAALQL